MRWSQYPVNTTKETPADAEVVSHQLMLRAGLIRKLAAGLYTWLPLGLRAMRKVENVVREEMDRAGALEVLMPGVNPPSCGWNPAAGRSSVPSCCGSRTATSGTSASGRRTRKSSPTSRAASSRATASCP